MRRGGQSGDSSRESYVQAFDVLVIGGGSSGCVVASRLSENGRRSVCLVEAGPDYGPQSSTAWPNQLLDARTIAWTHSWEEREGHIASRGRVIGGSSSMNGCWLAWGARQDYEEWHERTGAWGPEEIQPHRQSAAKALQSFAVTSNSLGAWQEAVMNAATQSGYVAANIDDDTAGPSVSISPLNVANGVRWNTAFAYLDNARDRTNLTILSETTARRLLVTDSSVVGAEIDDHGHRRTVYANQVILAAGAVGSPGILLWSGIGPADTIGRAGIKVVHDVPGVGSGLVDHPGVSVYFHPSNDLLSRVGPAGTLDYASQVVIKAASSVAQNRNYDTHIVVGSKWQNATYHIALFVFAMCPKSRGLVSIDAKRRITIDHRLLSDPEHHDANVLVEGIATARCIAASAALSPSCISSELSPGDGIRSSHDIRAWIATNHSGYWHATGTCAMGKTGDANAVVDRSGRVQGLDNLFIMDASVLPTNPSANTLLSTVAMAEALVSSWE